jgi:outer membrane protein
MNRSWYHAIFFMSLLIAVPFRAVQAGEAGKLYTLEEGIKEALENNWSVKGKEEKISESEFAKDEAKAGFYPTFGMTYSYTYMGNVPTIEALGMKLKMADQNNFQWKGTVTQPIFTGYALTSAYELSKLGIDLSKVSVELAKLDLALQVKESYFNILKTDKAVDVAKRAIESLESHLSTARNFYTVGMIPVNDVLKAEVELANARHNYIKAENGAKLARVAFNVLLSRSIDDTIQIEDILVYKPENPEFEQSLEKALKTRPEIISMGLNDSQIDEQIKLAKSKYYPQAALSYSYSKAGDTPSVSGSHFQLANQWQATLGMSWIFWDWDKTKNSVRQSESMKKQLSQTRKALEDGIRLQVKKAILDLKEAEEKIPTAKKAVEQAEENLRVSEERYKAQVTTSTEVLDAQTLLSQARMNYYEALYDHNLAKAGLLRAVGEY